VNLLFPFLFFVLWTVSGCDQPATTVPDRQQDTLGDLKVTDLQDPFDDTPRAEDLMNFRVLIYTVEPEAIDQLTDLYDRLPHDNIRWVNRGIFYANGFSAGVGTFRQGSEIARTLSQIGATRTADARLKFPVDETQIFSRIFLQDPERFYVSDLSGEEAAVTLGPGIMGWVFSAKPDPRFRGMAQVNFSPAVWQQGFEDFHFLIGKEPIDFQLLQQGQFLTRVEEGGFILIGPARPVPESNTLDKKLFFLPGQRPKIQFFIIICDSVGL
jgi:hypothetical protein